jgi:prephenate dehydratase
MIVPCGTFTSLLAAAASSERCDFAIAPLVNNNSGDVELFQRAWLASPTRLYVTDLFQHPIVHHLFSRANLADIAEVRSLEPAVKQSSKWLNTYLPDARKEWRGFKSTIDAVASLIPMHEILGVAAIGSEEAYSCGIPIRARNIQNDPNFTTFCQIERTRPSANCASRFLIAISEYSTDRDQEIDTALARCGCFYSSTWHIAGEPSVRICEVFNLAGPTTLESQARCIESSLKNSFFVGRYYGKTLTRLSVVPPRLTR